MEHGGRRWPRCPVSERSPRDELSTPVFYSSRQRAYLSSEHVNVSVIRERNPRDGKMKLGRNDRCPCGSGKKYKHCCLNSEAVPAATPADLTWRRLRGLLDGFASEM